MDRSDYHNILGLGRNATAAEIEASYLAITQFLDPQRIPPQLHPWAARQSALVDEAYAALTDTDEDEEVVVSTVAQAVKAGEAPASRPSVTRRRDEYPDDDFDPDTYEEEEDIVFPSSKSPTAPSGRRSGQTVKGKSGGLGEHAKWQQAGRRRRQGRDVPAPRGRQSKVDDDRMKKIVMGIGGAIVVLLVAYLSAVQLQLGPFGSNTDESSQAEKPVPINQTRYNQLVATANSDAKNFDAVFELGQMTFEAQRYEESITWLQKALVLRPDDVWSLLDVGTASFNLGNRERAFQMWQKALAVDANNPQTHWNLGFYYASNQPPDLEKAMQEWQRVTELSKPTDQLYKLAQTHMEQYRSRVATPTAR